MYIIDDICILHYIIKILQLTLIQAILTEHRGFMIFLCVCLRELSYKSVTVKERFHNKQRGKNKTIPVFVSRAGTLYPGFGRGGEDKKPCGGDSGMMNMKYVLPTNLETLESLLKQLPAC